MKDIDTGFPDLKENFMSANHKHVVVLLASKT